MAVDIPRRLPAALRWHAHLEPPAGADVRLTSSVGPGNEVLSLWASAVHSERLMARETRPSGVSFSVARPAARAVAVATVDGNAERRVTVVRDLPVAHGDVQPLPDDELLVVGARAQWRPSGPDRNAVVVNADGVVVREATVGDGVSNVLASVSGQVWVGYFDEGVYGSFGWGRAGAPDPMGRAGLVRFGPDLRPVWEFPSHVDMPWGAIDDCYALNVDGEAAWTCYYADFPLVRIVDDVVRAWANPVTGAGTILVGGDDVVFYSGHGADRGRLVHARLGSDAVDVVAEYQLAMPTGAEVPGGADVIARGPDLHVIAGDEWFRLGLEEVIGRG